MESTEITEKRVKAIFQSPKTVTATPARTGPSSEEIDFTNCPVVSTLAVFSFVNMAAMSGLSETCRMVLLIPNNEKAISTHVKSYFRKGMITATAVQDKASNTVSFFPIFPIRIPAGIEKSANHTNTIKGMVLDRVLDRPKSLLI